MLNPQEQTISDITAEKTVRIKGIALILLIWHHLFGCVFLDSWISPNKNLDILIGNSGRICLSIFLFCSGYGIYRSYISKESKPKTDIFQRIIKTLVSYWVVMIFAMIIYVALGKFEFKYIPLNLFPWINDGEILYINSSWYIKLYVLILLLQPLIKLLEETFKKKSRIIDILIYVVLPYVLMFFFIGYVNESSYSGLISSIISSILYTVFWFPLFAIGMLFAKYEIYQKILKLSYSFPKWIIIILSFIVCGVVIILRYICVYHGIFKGSSFYSVYDIFFAPVFIISCLLIMDRLKLKNYYVLTYLGMKSIYYWLLSSLFYMKTSELLVTVTWPRISILIFLCQLVLLTPFVFACDWVANKIIKLIPFNHSKSE